jgi:alpha-L-fucosidase
MAAYPRGREYAVYSESHWRELVERYRPSELWCDFGYPEDAETPAEDLFRWYLEQVPDGVVNDRFGECRLDGATVHSDFRTFEYKRDFSNAPQDRKWEACRGIGNSFIYNRQETDTVYSSSTELLHQLIDIVARGGNLLLNIGPTGAGEIPWLQALRLLDIGWWLRRYGQALYGTRRWERPAGTTGDGLQVRYTASDDAVHAIVLGAPREARVELDVRLYSGAEVTIEQRAAPLSWWPSDHGVRVELPERPDEQPAVALRLAPRAAVRAGAATREEPEQWRRP